MSPLRIPNLLIWTIFLFDSFCDKGWVPSVDALSPRIVSSFIKQPPHISFSNVQHGSKPTVTSSFTYTPSFRSSSCLFSKHIPLQKEEPTDASSSSSLSSKVLCIGETLWDILPHGMFLGGAPTNVAIHIASLQPKTPTAISTPEVSIVACINPKDDLGKETIQILHSRGVDTSFLQSPPRRKEGKKEEEYEYETGKVVATIDPSSGDASYTFDTPSAWDYLWLGKDGDDDQERYHEDNYQERFQKALGDVDAIVMGSICARLDPTDPFITNHDEHDDDQDTAKLSKQGIETHDATSASSYYYIRSVAKQDSLVLDINLRPPWYTPERILKLARGYDIGEDDETSKGVYPLALLKVNEDELDILEDWCHEYLLNSGKETFSNKQQTEEPRPLFGIGLQTRMEKIARLLNTNRICVTRGEHGAALWCAPHTITATTTTTTTTTTPSSSIFVEQEGYTYLEKDPNCDTVGAGDAFLGALIRSLFIKKESPEVALQRACALGCFVAGCQGAVPEHSDAPLHLKDLFSF